MKVSSRIIASVDRWLDSEVAERYKTEPLAQDYARVGKIAEELGEAMSELILMTGQNPRKGIDPDARDRMLEELADTALTAVFAIQHFTKDTDETEDIIVQKAIKIGARVPEKYRGYDKDL